MDPKGPCHFCDSRKTRKVSKKCIRIKLYVKYGPEPPPARRINFFVSLQVVSLSFAYASDRIFFSFFSTPNDKFAEFLMYNVSSKSRGGVVVSGSKANLASVSHLLNVNQSAKEWHGPCNISCFASSTRRRLALQLTAIILALTARPLKRPKTG